MPIRVVQFSSTPLAGAPIRVARSVAAHTGIQVRHVDLHRCGLYPEDHVHSRDPGLSLRLAEEADVIHLYNYLDLDSRSFHPVDFRRLWQGGKRFVRHFQSTPMRVAKEMKLPLAAVMDCPIPKIVIAQYPERFLPSARVVPNIVPQDDPEYLPGETAPAWDVLFTPTWMRSAWRSRWDTKGTPETMAMLRRVARRTGARVACLNGRPLAEVMREKRRARILIDEMATGSYHLSGLEGVSLGKPVLAHLDARTEFVLREMSGSSSSPFVNLRMEEAGEALCALIRDPGLCAETGRAARRWMEDHWRDSVLARHFLDVYETLMADPRALRRQESLRLDSPRRTFFAVTLPDMVHRERRRHSLRGGNLHALISLLRERYRKPDRP